MSDSRPVVIVGAGPAGAALAFILASRALPVVLIERQRDFEREFRGEVMMPSGLEALDQMGLAGEVETIAHQVPTRMAIYFRRRLVFEREMTKDLFRGASPPTTMSQPQLLERLVARASEHAGFRFIRGGSVKDLIREGDRISGVEIQREGRSERLDASLVVGADGRASTVRRRGGFEAIDRHAPMDVVWCKLSWPDCWKDERRVQAYVGAGHLLVVLPAPDGQLQLAWVILKGTFGEIRSRGMDAWVTEMAEHVTPELGAHLREHAGAISRPFQLKAATDHVTHWTAPGVLLVGDAAHTMSPVGGQGLNLALRDALVAANHLVPVLRAGARPAALDAAAARVEAERRPEIEEIQALAAMPPRLVLRPGRPASLARSLVARLLQLPFVQGRAAPIMNRFFYGTKHVSLEV